MQMEITISEPVADKIIDSCVGVDNRRYYKVEWQATWEPEDDLVLKYQHLVEAFWKHATDLESSRNLLNSLYEKLNPTETESTTQSMQAIVSTAAPTRMDEDLSSFYQEVNSPEHKVSDTPPSIDNNPDKPPPLLQTDVDEVRPYKCDQCSRSYVSVKKLKDHKRKLHTNVGTYQCSMCSKQFTTKRNLQQHMNRHTGVGPHACHGCSKRFMTTLEVETHKRSCNNLVEKEFQCDVCSKRFATKTHLSFHLKIHIPDSEKPFKCQYCPRTFSYNHDCIHHMRLHVGEKPFKCSTCNTAFHRKSYLTEHMFVHTGISKYRCDECLEYFKTQQMLQTHVKNVHILKKKVLTGEEKEQLKESKKLKKKQLRYRCDECEKEFRYLKEYHFHQIVNHKESIKEKKLKKSFHGFEPTMVYKCKICDKTFTWPSALKKHASTHENNLNDNKTTDEKKTNVGNIVSDVVENKENKRTEITESDVTLLINSACFDSKSQDVSDLEASDTRCSLESKAPCSLKSENTHYQEPDIPRTQEANTQHAQESKTLNSKKLTIPHNPKAQNPLSQESDTILSQEVGTFLSQKSETHCSQELDTSFSLESNNSLCQEVGTPCSQESQPHCNSKPDTQHRQEHNTSLSHELDTRHSQNTDTSFSRKTDTLLNKKPEPNCSQDTLHRQELNTFLSQEPDINFIQESDPHHSTDSGTLQSKEAEIRTEDNTVTDSLSHDNSVCYIVLEDDVPSFEVQPFKRMTRLHTSSKK